MGVYGDSSRRVEQTEPTVTTPFLSVIEGTAEPPQQVRNTDARTLPDGPAPPIHGRADCVAAQGATEQASTSAPVRTVMIGRSDLEFASILCPHCHRQGRTIQVKASGLCTWLSACLLCYLGCCIFAPFVFCLDCAKHTDHYCSHCRRFVARTLPGLTYSSQDDT